MIRIGVALLLSLMLPWYMEALKVADEMFRGLALVGYILLIGYLTVTWVRK